MSTNKNIFKSAYVGPTGVHLSCLTQTTLTGHFEMERQQSIHSGRQGKVGRNTSKARNPNRKGYLAKASKELDRRRRDYTITMNDKNIQPGEYKAPGSMNIR